MTRSILSAVAASLAAAGAFAVQAPAAQAHPVPALIAQAPKSLAIRAKNSIVGTWKVSYDGGVHNTFTQWHKDGTAIQVADFAPKTGNNVIVGDWSKNKDGSVSTFLVAWIWDDKGKKLINYFTKSETDTVVSADAYSGTFEVIYYDLQGNIVFQHDGTLSATRIAAQ